MEGGYGWIIVLATFLINSVIQGIIASSGILLNVLLDQFQAGKGVTGWIPSLLGGLLLAVGKRVEFPALPTLLIEEPRSLDWVPRSLQTFSTYFSLKTDQICFFILAGPFSSYLVEKSSCRTVTILGALVAAVGCFLSFFATSVRYLICSYGILTGKWINSLQNKQFSSCKF